MEEINFLFMDYETFNLNPKGGKVSQFAAIRTDYHLNIIPNSAVNYFCEQSDDNIPSPIAALVTKITPQKITRIKKGTEKINSNKFNIKPKVFNEFEFTKNINDLMTVKCTCTLGYNNIKFDDEFTRNLLYRNLFDPYEREWKNFNSRFDVYNLIMATYVLKPSLIIYPDAKDIETNKVLKNSVTQKPLPSFKLEELSVANGILHSNAHDAFSDVEATIELMKMIKNKDDFFFEQMFSFRKKSNVAIWMNNHRSKPFIHISQYYGRENNCFGIVYYLIGNDNYAICFNLSFDISPLIELDANTLKNELFNSENKEEKIKGLVKITYNQSPMLANATEYKDRMKEFSLNKGLMEKSLEKLRKNQQALELKLKEIYFNQKFDDNTNELDTDLTIYSGGFFNYDEKNHQKMFHNAIKYNELKMLNTDNFSQRMKEMVFKIKGRNFKDSLTSEELIKWNNYCKNRITDKKYGAEIILSEYDVEIENIKGLYNKNEDKAVIKEIDSYVQELKSKFKL